MEYLQIIGKGWESPVISKNIVGNYDTPIKTASKIEYKWDHPAGDEDKKLWGNVEYVSLLCSNYYQNRYGNDITNPLEVIPPAKFPKDELGSQRVDAPPNSAMEMTGKATTIYANHR